jgi:hypothetical protein
MGLDQFAYAADNQNHPQFTWRKHAKLQAFMENLFTQRTGQDPAALNCGALELSAEDITLLEEMVASNRLPESPGGFFYGHQFQDESAQEYREQDLAFCQWAKTILNTREKVIYSCWW